MALSSTRIDQIYAQYTTGEGTPYTNSYNQDDIELLFRRIYTEIERRYPSRTDYIYRYVSRKYTQQVAADMKAQRKEDVLLLNEIYK